MNAGVLSLAKFYIVAGSVALVLLFYVCNIIEPSTQAGRIGRAAPMWPLPRNSRPAETAGQQDDHLAKAATQFTTSQRTVVSTADVTSTESTSTSQRTVASTADVTSTESAPSHSATTEIRVTPKSYMFSLRGPEQLTMSTAHFHQFLNLVNDWGAFTGVEPFAYGTTMYGLRSIHASNPEGSVPFSKLFNASIHNDYLSTCMKRQPDPETGRPLLFETVTEFLRRSHRKIVVVYFGGHKHSYPVINATIRMGVEGVINRVNNSFSDCTSAARTHGMFKRVIDLLAKEIELERRHPAYPQLKTLLPRDIDSHFIPIQAFCIKRKYNIKISLVDLRDFILKRIHREGSTIDTSIIFTSWQGRFTRPLEYSDIKSYINTCRLPFSQPHHSEYVVNAAKRYIDSFDLHGEPYLSVHVRFEKLYYFVRKQHRQLRVYLNCCMDRLNRVLSFVAEKFNITSTDNILLHWDYSPYGSMEYLIKDSVEITYELLKNVSARPVYFDPKKFHINYENNIVSLIEMEALVDGVALVTVGGGSYQRTIINEFINKHSDSNDTERAEELHYGPLCTSLEDVHGIVLPPQC